MGELRFASGQRITKPFGLAKDQITGGTQACSGTGKRLLDNGLSWFSRPGRAVREPEARHFVIPGVIWSVAEAGRPSPNRPAAFMMARFHGS